MLGKSVKVKAIKFINLTAFFLSLALRLWDLFREADCFINYGYRLSYSKVLGVQPSFSMIKTHPCILKSKNYNKAIVTLRNKEDIKEHHYGTQKSGRARNGDQVARILP